MNAHETQLATIAYLTSALTEHGHHPTIPNLQITSTEPPHYKLTIRDARATLELNIDYARQHKVAISQPNYVSIPPMAAFSGTVHTIIGNAIGTVTPVTANVTPVTGIPVWIQGNNSAPEPSPTTTQKYYNIADPECLQQIIAELKKHKQIYEQIAAIMA